MMNFNDLKELTSARINTTANGQAFRDITTTEVKDAMLGEAVEYMALLALPEDAKLSAKVAFKIAQLAENDCDSAEDIGKLIVSRIMNVAERLQSARSKQQPASRISLVVSPGVTNAHAAAQGICLFIKRLQNKVARNSYYRHLEACKYEAVGGDMVTKSDYDGFQYVNITPDQITDVTDELYDELTVAYGYAVGLCDKYIQSKMSTFPFCSAPNDNGGFDEFATRQELWTSFEKRALENAADDEQALALI
jgi:hypothetical protein